MHGRPIRSRSGSSSTRWPWPTTLSFRARGRALPRVAAVAERAARAARATRSACALFERDRRRVLPTRGGRGAARRARGAAASRPTTWSTPRARARRSARRHAAHRRDPDDLAVPAARGRAGAAPQHVPAADARAGSRRRRESSSRASTPATLDAALLALEADLGDVEHEVDRARPVRPGHARAAIRSARRTAPATPARAARRAGAPARRRPLLPRAGAGRAARAPARTSSTFAPPACRRWPRWSPAAPASRCCPRSRCRPRARRSDAPRAPVRRARSRIAPSRWSGGRSSPLAPALRGSRR